MFCFVVVEKVETNPMNWAMVQNMFEILRSY